MADNTTYDHMVTALATPEGQQHFFSHPDSMNELFSFTPSHTHDVYDFIDPQKNPALLQTGRVVLITGASRGVGKGIALSFAKAEPKALVLCARSVEALEHVREEVLTINSSVKVLLQETDVTSESSVNAAFARAIETFGSVDVLISNAGMNVDKGNLADTSTEDWWQTYEVNVKGLYLVSKVFIEHLAGRPGTLVHITSTSSIGAPPTQTAYSASKLASNRIIEVLQLEYPSVRSFNLHPGIVDSQMTQFHSIGQTFGWTFDSAELAGCTSLWLTTPDADFLKGRWIAAVWRMDELKSMEQEIVAKNLLRSALSGKLGRSWTPRTCATSGDRE